MWKTTQGLALQQLTAEKLAQSGRRENSPTLIPLHSFIGECPALEAQTPLAWSCLPHSSRWTESHHRFWWGQMTSNGMWQVSPWFPLTFCSRCKGTGAAKAPPKGPAGPLVQAESRAIVSPLCLGADTFGNFLNRINDISV